jgi:hypothetical protein
VRSTGSAADISVDRFAREIVEEMSKGPFFLLLKRRSERKSERTRRMQVHKLFDALELYKI